MVPKGRKMQGTRDKRTKDYNFVPDTSFLQLLFLWLHSFVARIENLHGSFAVAPENLYATI